MSARILVLRTGQAVGRVHAHCGPFYRLFAHRLNEGARAHERVAVDEMDVTVREPGDALPPVERYHGAIMTGSPAFVGDDEPWMTYGADLLTSLLERDVPLLCVCFGHQLLGKALGSDVGPNERGREMGTVSVALDAAAVADDPLLGDQPAAFVAQCTHRDVIRTAASGVRVVGTSPHDACHVVRAGARAWGLQFHPEFDDVIMRLYLEARRDVLDKELGAGSCDRRIAAVRTTPEAASILPRFAALCRAEANRRGDAFVTLEGEPVDA
jgi:GMP synthase (glutamine-hydrolysing)